MPAVIIEPGAKLRLIALRLQDEGFHRPQHGRAVREDARDQRASHARDGDAVDLAGRKRRKAVTEAHLDRLRQPCRLHGSPRRLKRPLVHVDGDRVCNLSRSSEGERQFRMIGADVGKTRTQRHEGGDGRKTLVESLHRHRPFSSFSTSNQSRKSFSLRLRLG